MNLISEPFEAYQKRPELNCSKLKIAINSGMEFQMQSHPNYIPKPQSREMSLGTAVHCFVLEPGLFGSEYAVKPNGLSMSTKEGRQWKEDNKDKIVMSQEDHLFCLAMRNRMQMHPILANFISSSAEKERTILGQMKGVDAKARYDSFAHGAICDIKTSSARTPDDFMHDLMVYHYDMQAAFYRLIFPGDLMPPFFFAVMSTSVWQLWCINIDQHPEFVQSGFRKIERAFENIYRIKEALDLKNTAHMTDVPEMQQRTRWELEKY